MWLTVSKPWLRDRVRLVIERSRIGRVAARPRQRRCVSCRNPLPRVADPRRRYCSVACVARAYRHRVRMVDRYDRGRRIVHSFAELTRAEKAGIASGTMIIPRLQCPICHRVVWQGVRRRADAVYCSTACKSKAARQRRR